jgi:hypothetical protein
VNTDSAKTRQTDSGDEDAKADVESDPAKETEAGSDWSDEGGATPAGPATDTD